MIDQLNIIINHFLYTLNQDKRQGSISLFSGRSGTVLLFLELFKNTGDIIYKKALMENLEYIYNKIEHSDHLISTYCDGLAGWGCLIEHLNEEGIIEDEYDSILEEVDDVLFEHIPELLKRNNFDLLHGLLGIGIYFLKRKNMSVSDKIITHIFENCVHEKDEIKFVRLNNFNLNEEIYDLGLPHGMAGTLYYLSKYYQLNAQSEKCKKLMTGILSFYLNNIQKHEDSYFANSYLTSTYKKGNNYPSKSRLAWCYGDLTILFSLYRIAELLELKEEQDNIVKMLINLTNRKSVIRTSVTDATFCHGTAGVSYMFLKLYKLTAIEVFNTSANFWLKQTLEHSGKNGFGGYLFDASSTKEYHMISSSGLLEGISGVGLVMSAFQNKDSKNQWDEFLFLS